MMALADYIEMKPVIETERLYLREMNRNDVPALKKWMPDDSIYTYWGKGPGRAEKEAAGRDSPVPRYFSQLSFRVHRRVKARSWSSRASSQACSRG